MRKDAYMPAVQMAASAMPACARTSVFLAVSVFVGLVRGDTVWPFVDLSWGSGWS